MRVEISSERLELVGRRMAEVMNAAQKTQGFSVDEVICGMLFMAGCAIKQRGAVLHLDKPLREALPPVAIGYECSEHAEVWQIEAMRKD